MPELPEVETVCRALRPHLIGQKIASAKHFRPNLRIHFPANFASSLLGARIVDIKRRAKYILIFLDKSKILLCHLGMSGKLLVAESGVMLGKHDHVQINLESGKSLIYNDPRRFGLMDILDLDQLSSYKFLKDLGPEPFAEEFNSTYFINYINGKTTTIKQILLDSHFVVGIGNIYVSEILFRSKILPTRLASKISAKEADSIIANTRIVLQAAIDQGGSTIRDYKNADGASGYFQISHKVYGKAGQSCMNCESIIEKLVISGRSTFYCNECQH